MPQRHVKGKIISLTSLIQHHYPHCTNVITARCFCSFLCYAVWYLNLFTVLSVHSLGWKRIGCLIFTKIPGNSGWDVNGTRSFDSFHWKNPGTNGNSEKVVPVFLVGTSRMEIRVPLFSRFTCSVLVSGLLALSAVPVKRCASSRKFCLHGEQSVMFFPKGNSQRNFRKFGVNVKHL